MQWKYGGLRGGCELLVGNAAGGADMAVHTSRGALEVDEVRACFRGGGDSSGFGGDKKEEKGSPFESDTFKLIQKTGERTSSEDFSPSGKQIHKHGPAHQGKIPNGFEGVFNTWSARNLTQRAQTAHKIGSRGETYWERNKEPIIRLNKTEGKRMGRRLFKV